MSDITSSRPSYRLHCSQCGPRKMLLQRASLDSHVAFGIAAPACDECFCSSDLNTRPRLSQSLNGLQPAYGKKAPLICQDASMYFPRCSESLRASIARSIGLSCFHTLPFKLPSFYPPCCNDRFYDQCDARLAKRLCGVGEELKSLRSAVLL